MASKEAAQKVAGRAAQYKWVKPEIYPLFVTMALGVGMCAYAWGNNIFNNPGISYNKAHRSDQEARDDDPHSLSRSKRYTSGIFRRLGDVRP
ncbi:hypothetical protein WJX81_006298 [Elliptochloris bilobata]|uniref:Uncharacterized protein n=1 Tax=Elliptochloris bilobata TaxID=381761 RepID=A0AAW1RMM7_9CHLO